MAEQMNALPLATRNPEVCFFEAGLEGRYLLHQPEFRGPKTLLVLTLHGYGSNPEAMLRLSVPVVGAEHVVAAIQAPNQFYLGAGPSASGEIGYNWGTRVHGESNIRTHHRIVRQVRAELEHRFAIPARRTVLMGFSQPVGLNYRFIGTHPEDAGAVLGICGGVPKDWNEDKYHQFRTPVMHIARSEDEFFPAAVTEGFPARLRRHAGDVTFHQIEGGHRFPSKARGLVQPWLERVFGL
ncbi:MAG: hypothetical protein K2X35_22680 [Bryobacteraceae bacterium]|nr:hypothetical protein [Bryobacteraceae bacterium]